VEITITLIIIFWIFGCVKIFIDWQEYCYQQRIREGEQDHNGGGT